MSNRISYPIVLLVFLAGCLPQSEPQDPNEGFEVLHHPGTLGLNLVKVKKLHARDYSFRVGINVDKALYLDALDADPIESPTIEGAELTTALDITITVTDTFGRVRIIEPICPPVVDPTLNPSIRENFVRLSPLIQWDRLSDDGQLMKGRVTVTVEATLLEEHDHRFHDELDSHVIDSSVVAFHVKLPTLHNNNDDDDDDDQGEDED